jgi:nucleoid-associated protein YgaU
MNKNYLLIALGFVSLLFAGCAPELARTNYGPEEQQWKDYIQKSYNGWQPPPTPAPYSENNVSASVSSSVDSVPLASATDIPGVIESAPVVQDTLPKPENLFAPVQTATNTYTVQKGDTLWSIAQKVYGNGNNWKNIKEANKDVLVGSNTLKAGMILKIPALGK